MDAKRDRIRTMLRDTFENLHERRAAIHNYRLLHDPAYTRRFSRYLKGEIEIDEVHAGETPEAWYERVRGEW